MSEPPPFGGPVDKVYLVVQTQDFGYFGERSEVMAACTTTGKAEALAEALVMDVQYNHPYHKINFSVEECVLDPDWVNGYYVIVRMDREGALVEEPVRHICIDEIPWQAIVGFDETHDEVLCLSHFAATGDVDDAVKQTDDIRKQAIDLGYWPDDFPQPHDYKILRDAGNRLGAHLGVRSTRWYNAG